jgi:hypothetical protein
MALQNSSYDETLSASTPTPPKKKDPWILIVILVLVGGALAVMLIPSVSAPFHKAFPTAEHPALNPAVRVWVNQNTGRYYCADSVFYGRAPGEFKEQGDALTAGYQPALGDYCKELKSTDSKELKKKNRPSRSRASTTPSRPTDSSARRR